MSVEVQTPSWMDDDPVGTYPRVEMCEVEQLDLDQLLVYLDVLQDSLREVARYIEKMEKTNNPKDTKELAELAEQERWLADLVRKIKLRLSDIAGDQTRRNHAGDPAVDSLASFSHKTGRPIETVHSSLL